MPIIDSYTLVGSWPQAEVDLSVEALAAGMQARGVSQSLVTYTGAIFYHSAMGNTQVMHLASQHQPLTAVAVINPFDYPDCLDEVNRCLDRGVKVFRLCPREHGYPFSGSFGPLREVLRRLEMARLLLVDVVGLPAPVIAADVEDLLPVPTAFTVDGTGLSTLIYAAKQGPNVWVETSRLDAGGAVEAAVKHIGANRVIFGSGSPLRAIGSAVMSVQYAELSEADRLSVFEGNVQRVLG
ncbi:MAG: putative metal-dependent hydrolase of the TIM-barrel fold [Armatimonadetes bacterium]|nr:putative metal-dependent hydrolase of the TIM-barrel fold [Armatimonadota bacterium]